MQEFSRRGDAALQQQTLDLSRSVSWDYLHLFLASADSGSFRRAGNSLAIGLAKLLSDILVLDISEGALVNMLEPERHPFSTQTSLICARLLSGTALESDETGVRAGKRNCRMMRRASRTLARIGRCIRTRQPGSI